MSLSLPPKPQAIFNYLDRAVGDARVEGMEDGCYVLSCIRRGGPGRVYVYCAPGGSWTHNQNRAAQLAERFPLESA